MLLQLTELGDLGANPNPLYLLPLCDTRWYTPSQYTVSVAISGRGHLMYSSLPANSSSHKCLAARAGREGREMEGLSAV